MNEEVRQKILDFIHRIDKYLGDYNTWRKE